MLSIKPANFDDAEQEWRFVAAMPADENGFTNQWHGVTRARFLAEALPEMLRFAEGVDLPDGFVPQTFLFLWQDGEIVGQFRVRHVLNDALRSGAGHIGYYIAKEYRGLGFAAEGLRLTLAWAATIVPEEEFYLRVNKNNPASLRVMFKNGGRIVGETEDKFFVRIPKDNGDHYVCKTASLEEMNAKWNKEIERHPDSQSNWLVWKREAMENAESGRSVPYYGILRGRIICEATALLHPDAVQNSEGLVDEQTAYLCAFRTVPEYQGQGYFSKLFHFMLEDLAQRGYQKVTLGVEPHDEKNLNLYRHFGFTERIKRGKEIFPDGTVIDVDYYGRSTESE